MDTQTDALTIVQISPADLNPAVIYLASLGAGSQHAQRSALRQVARIAGGELETLDWCAIRYQHAQYIRARLLERYAPATANRLIVALRRTLFHGWKLGFIPDAEYRKMADLASIRSSTDDGDLSGRALSQDELTALLQACDRTMAGIRDAAIIALGYGLGLRRSEISKLELSDYDPDRGLVFVRSGKGNKSRTLPIDGGAHDALEDWLKIRGNSPGRVFRGVNKRGELSSMGLGVDGVDSAYQRRVVLSGLAPTHFHDLRRSFISDLFDANVDISTIARLAGHSDSKTTLGYDRRRFETRRRAAALLHVPYSRS